MRRAGAGDEARLDTPGLDVLGLEALFTGLSFYGTGGGGSAQAGLALLRQEGLAPSDIAFAPIYTLPDDAPVACGIIIGGRDPADPLDPAARAALGVPAGDLDLPTRFEKAVRLMSARLGTPLRALVPVELGSLATAALLIAAHRLGLPVLDADAAGRCIPELGMTKLDLAGLSPAPLALVDRLGGEAVIGAAASATMADRMARQLNRAASGRGLACLAYPGPLGQLRGGLVAGSIGHAMQVGRRLCGPGTAAERLEAVLAFAGGELSFEGEVSMRWRSEEPYAFREAAYELVGTGPSASRRARIWIKNEHHFLWVDGALAAASPDPIAVLDAASLVPLASTGEAEGRRVAVVRVPVLDTAFETPEGRALFDPRRLGVEPDRRG
ncbi:DUF917 domain-containing protein [Ancylobacter mangrovi]|uniref:DUF917 domain-containing protein n=1 Tax=Ancylobacter mangrovi TaxID=2972472 RepID=UPI00216130C0|nr:DUF917 domain-containing protein [Ancylobacter mangrovi]MCS0505108.1 DUF917 domain-containing protein [Ancylobacter mangrovi]